MGVFDYRDNICDELYSECTITLNNPHVVLRVSMGGAAVVSGDGWGIDESPDMSGLYLMTNKVCRVMNQRGHNSLVAPLLTLDRMRAMLAGQRVPAVVEGFLNGPRDDAVLPVRTTPRLRALATEARANPYVGVMARLYLTGKVYEMLAEVFTVLEETQDAALRTVSRDRRAAATARDALLNDLANPPSVEELARMVGVSQRRLNEVFRDMYGDTVMGSLTKWRMEQARSLLARGELSIKQVAYSVGYAHPSNFIRAFSRCFGESPGSLSRGDIEGISG